MNKINNYYLRERKFNSDDNLNIDDESILYWKKYWKNVDIIKIEHQYGCSLQQLLFSKKQLPIENSTIKQIEYIINIYRTNENSIPLKDSFALKNRMYFSNYFARFENFAIYLLSNKFNNIQSAVLTSFRNSVLNRLGSISLRTLILEMHDCKNNGKLGGDSYEQYNEFNNKLKDTDCISELFIKYPALKRMVFECILYITNQYISFIKHYRKDTDLLSKEYFSNKSNPHIIKINSDNSDSHKKGTTVFIITFDNNKKIVYKARSLKPDIAIQETLDILNPKIKCPMKKIHIIDRENYGWEEFIEHISCTSNQQLKRYYYRFGVLLFVSYIMNSTDLHEENIIAHGEYPVIIDGEALFNNIKSYQNPSANDRISILLKDSVLSSGLLPKMRFGKHGDAIDMSALEGHGGEKYPFKIPYVVDEYTSNMHLEYTHPQKQNKNNIVFINGHPSCVKQFADSLVKGFSDSYNNILQQKTQFIYFINSLDNFPVRYVIDDTQRYAMLLHLSYHPEFLKDCRDRELFLCSLYGKSSIGKNEQIVSSEIGDMLNMDIPYFSFNIKDTFLEGTNGIKIPNYFSDTAVERVISKINQMSNSSLNQQVKYINITLNGNSKTVNSDKVKTNFAKKDEECIDSHKNSLLAVQRIANHLLENAIWGHNKKDINWICAMPIGNDDDYKFDIRPLNFYLYEGLSGIAIFFAALSKKIPCSEYSEAFTAISNSLFSYTDEKLSDGFDFANSGLYSGEAGIVYAYTLMYKLTGKICYLDYAKRHSAALNEISKNDKQHDIVYGNSGAVLAFINLFMITKDPIYVNYAVCAGNSLVESQKDDGSWNTNPHMNSLAGMSHGVAGIVLALGKLWNISPDNNYLSSIKKGIQFEDTLYDSEHKNWKDERIFYGKKVSNTGKYTIAWCHGAPGIMLSRAKLYQIIGTKYIPNLLQYPNLALKNVINKKCLGNCLCHGNIGNTEIFLEYNRILRNNAINCQVKERRNIFIQEISKDTDMGINSLYGYLPIGFMNGITGIGYSILRDLFSDLPCVLSGDIEVR